MVLANPTYVPWCNLTKRAPLCEDLPTAALIFLYKCMSTEGEPDTNRHLLIKTYNHGIYNHGKYNHGKWAPQVRSPALMTPLMNSSHDSSHELLSWLLSWTALMTPLMNFSHDSSHELLSWLRSWFFSWLLSWTPLMTPLHMGRWRPRIKWRSKSWVLYIKSKVLSQELCCASTALITLMCGINVCTECMYSPPYMVMVLRLQRSCLPVHSIRYYYIMS